VLGLGQLLGRSSSLLVAVATLAVVRQTMQPTPAELWLRPRRGVAPRVDAGYYSR
jgi:hypothetical protein